MCRIRSAAVAALLVSMISLPASAMEDQGRGQQRRQEVHARNQARREARQAYWDASRYYTYSPRYRAQRVSRNDRIYRGSDNNYYCRRDDGTTGLIIGATAGAVLGNIIAPGESKVIGTIIGGGAGALIGRAIDDGDLKCG